MKDLSIIMISSSRLCCREEIWSRPSLVTIRYENIENGFHYFLAVSISLSLANTINLEIVIVLLLHLFRYSHIFPLWLKINLSFPFEKHEVLNLFAIKPRPQSIYAKWEIKVRVSCKKLQKRNYVCIIIVNRYNVDSTSLFHSASTKTYFTQ